MARALNPTDVTRVTDNHKETSLGGHAERWRPWCWDRQPRSALLCHLPAGKPKGRYLVLDEVGTVVVPPVG